MTLATGYLHDKGAQRPSGEVEINYSLLKMFVLP